MTSISKSLVMLNPSLAAALVLPYPSDSLLPNFASAAEMPLESAREKAQRIVPFLVAATDARPFAEGVERTRFAEHIAAQRTRAALGDDIDDTADSVRSPQGALWPADDFDMVDIVERKAGEVEGAGRRSGIV